MEVVDGGGSDGAHAPACVYECGAHAHGAHAPPPVALDGGGSDGAHAPAAVM
jgi:hypothetical protein